MPNGCCINTKSSAGPKGGRKAPVLGGGSKSSSLSFFNASAGEHARIYIDC